MAAKLIFNYTPSKPVLNYSEWLQEQNLVLKEDLREISSKAVKRVATDLISSREMPSLKKADICHLNQVPKDVIHRISGYLSSQAIQVLLEIRDSNISDAICSLDPISRVIVFQKDETLQDGSTISNALVKECLVAGQVLDLSKKPIKELFIIQQGLIVKQMFKIIDSGFKDLSEDQLKNLFVEAYTNNCPELLLLLLKSESVLSHIPGVYLGLAFKDFAAKGREGLVKIMMESEAIMARISDLCLTNAFAIGVANGHEGIVKMMMESEAIMARVSDDCWIGLAFKGAAANGHEGLVKMMMESEAIMARVSDDWWIGWGFKGAVTNGHENIVKMMMESEAIKARISDDSFVFGIR